MTFAEIISVAIGAILVSNVLLSQFWGICSFIGVSKKKSSAIGMGVAVLFVLVLSSLVTWVLYHYVLIPYKVEFLSTKSTDEVATKSPSEDVAKLQPIDDDSLPF